jgi:DNA-binding transcriptional regulator YiaG
MPVTMIQFIQKDPEKFKEELIKEFRTELESLKKDFQPKEPTKYLSRKDLTELLGINISTVRNWTEKGILKPYGIEGRVFFKRDEVEDSMIPLDN